MKRVIMRYVGILFPVILTLLPTAPLFAVVDTFYATASDGYVYTANFSYSPMHETCEGAGGCCLNYNAGATPLDAEQTYTQFGVNYKFYRVFLFFDTSFLPTDATISDAQVYLYGTDKRQDKAGQSDLYLVEGVQNDPLLECACTDCASETPKVTPGGNVIAYASFVTSGWNTITLNATGIGWVVKGGITKFCVKTSGDVSATTPYVDGTDKYNYLKFSSYEGGAQKPFIIIDYTLPCTPASVTGHPSNQTKYVGENTSFTITASGTEPITYQWQVNTGSGWNNITAAGSNPTYANWTTATLGANVVALGNNGYQYRCYVDNACGTDTSDAATLYVESLPCQVPRNINYQAKLTNLDGTALEDSDRKMAFMLYNISTGGTPLWAETLSVNLVSGLFDVQLGTVHPIDLDFCEPYWIQMKIDGNDDGDVVDDPDDELMTPREKLAPVGYAFRSIYSDTAAYVSGGGSSTTTTSGEYSGNSTVNRAVPHGLGRTPNAVLIFAWGSTWYRIFAPYPGIIHYMDASAQGGYAVTAMDATNFYVGSSSDYHLSANLSLEAYIWIAF